MKALNKSIKIMVLSFILSLYLLVEVGAQSNIYDKKFRLYVDTNLSISESQYKLFSKKERSILYVIYSNTSYPAIYLENEVSGSVILSFEINTTNNIQNIKIVKGEYPHFNESAIKAVKESAFHIESYLGNNSNEQETYYIPFDFKCVDYQELVQKSKSVIIKEPTTLLLEVD